MRKIDKKILTAAICILLGAGLLYAQGPGFGLRGKAGPGFLAAVLDLTDAQKAKAEAIFADARQQGKPVMDQLRSGREAMAAAVKANDTAKIKQLADSQAALLSQLIAIQNQAMAQFYATLTPEQKAKADKIQSRIKERIGERIRKPRF